MGKSSLQLVVANVLVLPLLSSFENSLVRGKLIENEKKILERDSLFSNYEMQLKFKEIAISDIEST